MKPLERDEKGRWKSRRDTVHRRLRAEAEARRLGLRMVGWRESRPVVIVQAGRSQ
jgi:hypothetical protein